MTSSSVASKSAYRATGARARLGNIAGTTSQLLTSGFEYCKVVRSLRNWRYFSIFCLETRLLYRGMNYAAEAAVGGLGEAYE